LSFFAEWGDACMFWRVDEASPSTRFVDFFMTPGILDRAKLAGGCVEEKKKEGKGLAWCCGGARMPKLITKVAPSRVKARAIPATR
jgi:hypothetical protein